MIVRSIQTYISDKSDAMILYNNKTPSLEEAITRCAVALISRKCAQKQWAVLGFVGD